MDCADVRQGTATHGLFLSPPLFILSRLVHVEPPAHHLGSGRLARFRSKPREATAALQGRLVLEQHDRDGRVRHAVVLAIGRPERPVARLAGGLGATRLRRNEGAGRRRRPTVRRIGPSRHAAERQREKKGPQPGRSPGHEPVTCLGRVAKRFPLLASASCSDATHDASYAAPGSTPKPAPLLAVRHPCAKPPDSTTRASHRDRREGRCYFSRILSETTDILQKLNPTDVLSPTQRHRPKSLTLYHATSILGNRPHFNLRK